MTDTPSTTVTDTSDTITTIEPGEVPQAGLPIEIEEEGVPLFGLPRTGDDSATYGMLLGCMGLAAVGGILILRKKREAEN